MGMAPGYDLPDGYEMWGMSWDAMRPHFSRLFEMHDISELKTLYTEKYFDQLRSADVPLYMQEHYEEIPNSIRYPIEQVDNYLCSSVAYMLSLAISENPDEIGLFGVDMDLGGAYEYQKANTEYLIGLARGKGIKVTLPEQSPLMKFAQTDSNRYIDRYGHL